MTGFVDLVDRTVERGTASWSCTFQLLVLLVGFSVCAAGLMYTAHVWLEISPWIFGLATVSGAGVSSYALARHRRR